NVPEGQQYVATLRKPIRIANSIREQAISIGPAVIPNLGDLHGLLVELVLNGAAIIVRIGYLCVERAGPEIAVIVDQQGPLGSEHRAVLAIVPFEWCAHGGEQVRLKIEAPV